MTLAELEQIWDTLAGQSVAVFIHERADADAIGSAEAFRMMAESVGIRTKLCSPDPIAPNVEFLEALPAEPEPDDILLSIDVASPAQLGRYAVFADRFRLSIDHHASGARFAPTYLDTTAAAAGEIVFDFYRQLRETGKCGEMPLRFYTCLYAAISSDTGCFRYSNVTPATHLRAAEILRQPINAAEINRQLFDSHSPEEIAAMGAAYPAIRYYAGGQAAFLTFTSEMQHRSHVSEQQLGMLIDIPRSIRGVLVAAVLKQSQTDPRVFRVSFRANAEIDVAAVAARFGGGGHPRAAGATIEADSPELAEQQIAAAVSDALTEGGCPV